MNTSPVRHLTRRSFLGAAGITGVAGMAASGCAGGLKASAGGTAQVIKIGYISPKTGTLAVFTESDAYVLARIRNAVSKGLRIGGKNYSVEIITKDSQSSSARAASAAAELIQQDRVDFLLATSTPDTTNPVSDQAEASGVPCLATICPWEMWFYTRGGSATKTFTYTYLYFIGVQEETDLFSGLWQRIASNHVVGTLWPNDVDGDVYRKYVSPKVSQLGWQLVASAAYPDGMQDFTSVISTFKSHGVEILQATPIPPDWVTFWRQSEQNRFKPRLACVAKALLFPSVADSLGPLAQNLVAPAWWAPSMPYRSSLDGTSAAAFASGYLTSTGRQWTQPMGFNYAIFEIAIAALRASGDPRDAAAVAAAIGRQKGEVMTGPFDFTTGPVKNVATAPDFLGQWRAASSGGYNLVIVDNSMNPAIPVQGSLQLL